jgi:hypothetical protein
VDPDENEDKVVHNEEQGLRLLLEVQALEDAHDVDDVIHFQQLEVFEDGVELLHTLALGLEPEQVFKNEFPVKGGQAVDHEFGLQVVDYDLARVPDELANAVVEVTGDKAKHQVSVKENLSCDLDPFQDDPGTVSLTKPTFRRGIAVNEEELERNKHRLIDSRDDHSEVIVKQKSAFLRKDVPPWPNQV